MNQFNLETQFGFNLKHFNLFSLVFLGKKSIEPNWIVYLLSIIRRQARVKNKKYNWNWV